MITCINITKEHPHKPADWKKKMTQFSFILEEAVACESGSPAGSQDELVGNHLRDLSMFLF